jgi:large subunit ribosomal protein L13
MKTYTEKKVNVDQKWWLIDAEDKVLGRVASTVASLLRGKHKPTYTPFVDMGDYVVIINSAKVKLTGNKSSSKLYYRHTGYPGGLKVRTYSEMMKKDPTFVLRNAIKGMLPHNRLGRRQLLHVKIYPGEEHSHQAQKPEPFKIT